VLAREGHVLVLDAGEMTENARKGWWQCGGAEESCTRRRAHHVSVRVRHTPEIEIYSQVRVALTWIYWLG
jgi:hypothetical protein